MVMKLQMHYQFKEDSKDIWIPDSSCTFHMTPHKQWLEDFTPCERGSVLLGDNKAYTILGSGNVKIKMHSGQVKLITEVKHVPDLKRNLLSIGMLDKKGYVISANDGNMKVCHGSMIVMRGKRMNVIYMLEGKTIIGSVAIADKDNSKLWHLRLGHESEKGLQELSKQGLLGKDQVHKLDFCENCVLGKSKRLQFNTATHTTTKVLKYVHSDLWVHLEVQLQEELDIS